MDCAATPSDPRLRELLDQEARLRYPDTFTSADALELGRAVAELSREYDRGVGVSVVRESDGLTLFQWMADDKAPRNLGFMEGKRLAALESGHCSLWCEVAHDIDGSYGEMLADGTPECPGAGAFPIRVGDDWVATVAVSGLHHGQDHELVVRALEQALAARAAADTDTPETR